MKTHELKTEQGRKSAIEEIEQSFIKSLREIGVELSEGATCDMLCSSCIDLYHYDLSMSQVTIWAKHKTNPITKINFGSSGSFTPEETALYWRTIHAASILKNWGKVCEAVNHHCKLYSELVEEIMKQNPN
jgi:hypothetical protein